MVPLRIPHLESQVHHHQIIQLFLQVSILAALLVLLLQQDLLVVPVHCLQIVHLQDRHLNPPLAHLQAHLPVHLLSLLLVRRLVHLSAHRQDHLQGLHPDPPLDRRPDLLPAHLPDLRLDPLLALLVIPQEQKLTGNYVTIMVNANLDCATAVQVLGI